MITFTLFNENGLDSDWFLRHAHLLGVDNIVAPGAVKFEGGFIRCDPLEPGSTALALQWDAGDLGVLTLQTTLLPHRDKPYLLSLELARHRIMLFFVKLETWSEFDRPNDDPAMVLFDQARARFTTALIMESDPELGGSPQQDFAAREALQLAIQASELLALSHASGRIQSNADKRIEEAAKTSAPTLTGARPTIGVVVHPERVAEPLQKLLTDSVDFITVPIRWSDLEPEEGTYSFKKTDQWIEWAVRSAKVPVIAGPLIDLQPGCVPDWLYIWENDYDTLRELVYEHVKKVVTRYRRAVSHWIIASGLHVAGNFSLTLEQVVDLTRISAMIVRKLHPRANIRVEIAQPFGEYGSNSSRTLAPQLYAEIIAQAGAGVDGFGIQLLMGDVSPGRSTRDLMAIADLLDRFGVFNRPLSISLLGAPAQTPDLADTGGGEMDPGYWRQPWSEAAQADWLKHLAVIALGHPAVTSVCWQALYDTKNDADMRAGGLIDSQGKPRASLATLRELHSRLQSGAPVSELVQSELTPGASAT